MRLSEPSSENAVSKNAINFRLRVNANSKKLYTNKVVPIALQGMSLFFTDSNRKFDLEDDILDMMNNNKFSAISIEDPKDNELLLDFLDDMRFDARHTLKRSARAKRLVKLVSSPAMRAGFFHKVKTKRLFY